MARLALLGIVIAGVSSVACSSGALHRKVAGPPPEYEIPASPDTAGARAVDAAAPIPPRTASRDAGRE
jgi:hypothetical protein